MHDEYQGFFYTGCQGVTTFVLLFSEFFLLLINDFYKYHNIDFIHIHQHSRRFNCDFIMQYLFNSCFLKIYIYHPETNVSEHCFNQFIDKYIFIKRFDYFFQFHRFLQKVYNISYMIGINFLFYTISSVKEKVYHPL